MSKNKIKSKDKESEQAWKSEINPTKKTKGKATALQQFKTTLQNEKTHQITGVFLILFSLYLTISFVSYFLTSYIDFNYLNENSFNEMIWNSNIRLENWGGRMGGFFSFLFIEKMFGIGSTLIPFLLFISGFQLLKLPLLPYSKTCKRTTFWILFISISLGYANSFLSTTQFLNLSGSFGWYLSQWLIGFGGKFGLGIILLFTLIVYLVLNHQGSLSFLKTLFSTKKATPIVTLEKSNEMTVNKRNTLKEEQVEDPEEDLDFSEEETKEMLNFEVFRTEPKKNTEITPPSEADEENTSSSTIDFEIESLAVGHIEEENIEEDESAALLESYGIDTPYDPKLDLANFKFPSLNSLINYEEKNVEVSSDELIANKDKIVETLKNYAIDIVKIVASPGPTVTLYEIIPAPGIRISKIRNLEDDIALSLSALGIRIIAPIPGRGTIGIEVPNAKPQIVSMKTMLSSDKFVHSKFELPIAIGKTISNEPFVADLAKMPHLLMAGATGQGKSVGLNAIISSLLFKKHPAELKFVLVDPKKVELSLYTKIERHYLAKMPDSEEAIITDTRKVVRTLNSLCIEMDSRYDLLKDAQVKNIKEYNTKFTARRLNPENGHRYLPYIVLVVDEFADLIMTAGKEVETPIARLAQLARAVGIHLIIATQRPSVNIITGTIKANFPARIAFRVTSKIDSRTILDSGGAEQLIGRGDMLLSYGSDLTRLQCALIDTEEIEEVAEFIGNQRGYPSCFELPEYLDENSEPNKDFDPNQRDEKFEEAARIVVSHQHGSTSLLQRKLQLGYNRAGRIIDQLEAAGIVGPFEGSKAREVKIKTEMELEEYLKSNRIL